MAKIESALTTIAAEKIVSGWRMLIVGRGD